MRHTNFTEVTKWVVITTICFLLCGVRIDITGPLQFHVVMETELTTDACVDLSVCMGLIVYKVERVGLEKWFAGQYTWCTWTHVDMLAPA